MTYKEILEKKFSSDDLKKDIQEFNQVGREINKLLPTLGEKEIDNLLVFAKNKSFDLIKRKKNSQDTNLPNPYTVSYEERKIIILEELGVEFGQKNLLFLIDKQKDFTEIGGSLYVPGGEESNINTCKFIDLHRKRIDDIILTKDDHFISHIGNSAAWRDKSGKKVDSFITITSAQVEKGEYVPVYITKERALEYLRKIESKGATHTLWPLHCKHGDAGQSFPKNLIQSLEWWMEEKKKHYITVAKGSRDDAEMYSVFSYADDSDPEYTKRALDWLAGMGHDKIFIAGEAKDICVAESVKDLMKDERFKGKLVFLDSCMASINTKSPNLKVYEEAIKNFGAKKI